MEENLKRLIFTEKKPCVKIIIKKEDLKNHLLGLKSNFKKLMDNFFTKNFNTSFGILTLMNYLLILKVRLYEINPNINMDLSITADEENFYIRFILERFYEKDFTKYNNEQAEVFFNTKLNEEEKYVLGAYISNIVTEKQIEERFDVFVNFSFNIDNYIKILKEDVKNGKLDKKMFNFKMLEILFDIYAIIVLQNQLETQKEYMELEYGKEN